MDKTLATEEQEKWLDIKGFEGYYQISNRGRVKSLGRYVTLNGFTFFQLERIMAPWCGTTSLYDCVRLYRAGRGQKFSIHRLVAWHFLPDWDEGLEVNHIDGNRSNNAAANLEMCTRQENVRHSIIHMLKKDYGEKSSNAKLTNAQAQEIRRQYRSRTVTQEMLASQYGVCRQTISAIVRYKKYIR